MAKPNPPRPPNPVTVANAQTQSNRDTAIAESYLNNVNQVTPWGSVLFDITGTGPNGVPRWTQTTSLSPDQQQLNDLGTRNSIDLAGLAGSGINTARDVLGTDYTPRRFNTDSATGGRLDIDGSLGDYNGDVEARTRELATRGLGREFDRSEESLRSRLAAQGVNAGSEAFGSELEGFNQAKGDAFARAELMARDTARSDRGAQLNELLTGRGTNLSEALQQYQLDDQADFNARSRPLNEITALNSGSQLYYQPTTPGRPNPYGIAGTDIAGIYNQGFANQMGIYNSQMNARGGVLGGLAELGAAAITASDRRLKRDAEYLYEDDAGNRWWSYRYVWDSLDAPRRIGVMADEVPAQARIMTTSGYYAVDYGALP